VRLLEQDDVAAFAVLEPQDLRPPDGASTLVERDLALTFIPRGLDIWRLRLDASAHYERRSERP
jgi:hypothetical protein